MFSKRNMEPSREHPRAIVRNAGLPRNAPALPDETPAGSGGDSKRHVHPTEPPRRSRAARRAPPHGDRSAPKAASPGRGRRRPRRCRPVPTALPTAGRRAEGNTMSSYQQPDSSHVVKSPKLGANGVSPGTQGRFATGNRSLTRSSVRGRRRSLPHGSRWRDEADGKVARNARRGSTCGTLQHREGHCHPPRGQCLHCVTRSRQPLHAGVGVPAPHAFRAGQSRVSPEGTQVLTEVAIGGGGLRVHVHTAPRPTPRALCVHDG